MKTISGVGIGKKYGVKGKRTQRTRLILYRLGYLCRIEKGKRSHRILKELPESPGELWKEYCKRFYTKDLDAAIGDAHSEIEELAQEMEEWSSNLEDGGLGHTYVAEQAYECGDVLMEQAAMLGDLATPDSLADTTLMVPIPYDTFLLSGRSRNIGRGKRLGNALVGLQTAADWVRLSSAKMSVWAEELQEIIDELGAVEFPGAYG